MSARPQDPTLFSPYPGGLPASHAGGHDTEETAAELAHANASKTRLAVLEFLQGRGADGATDHEGEEALSMFSYQRRRTDLSQSEPALVVDSGRRRISPRGRPMIVWIHASFAAERSL
jgi:hypothetical protein